MRVVVRNITWLLLSQITTWLVSVVMLVLAPRYLGDTDYGKVQFAIVFVSFFQLAAGLGSDTYIVKETARDEAQVGRYVFNAAAMKVLLGAALSVLAIGLAYALGYEGELILLIAIFCVSLFNLTLANTVAAGLQGLQQMSRPAWASAVQYIISYGVALLVLERHGSLTMYAIALTAGSLIPLLANTMKFWPYMRRELHVDFRLWKRIARGGLPFLTWGAILTVYGSIDLPILQSMAGSTQVGWYTLAYRWVAMPAVFASVVGTAILPSLSARFESISYAFAAQANKAIRLVFFIGAPCATGMILVAGGVVHLLYPNSGFEHAVPVMQILALHLPIVTVTMTLGTVLIASDRQNKYVLVGCAAAALNIGLNLLAIPWSMRAFDNGAIGASIVTVTTECLMLAGSVHLRPTGVLDRATVGNLLRCTIACLVMVPPVLALHTAPLPLQVAAGVATFGVASVALGVVKLDELRGGLSHTFRSAGRAA